MKFAIYNKEGKPITIDELNREVAKFWKVKYTKTEDYINDFISNSRNSKDQVENMSKLGDVRNFFNTKERNIQSCKIIG